MTLSSWGIGVASVIVLAVSAAPALAQRQDGSFGGVLGGNTTANARNGLTVEGSLFGAWVSGMAAAAIPNSRLKSFQEGIERGQVLLMIDLPFSRIADVEELVTQRYPAAKFGGVEPHIPAFP